MEEQIVNNQIPQTPVKPAAKSKYWIIATVVFLLFLVVGGVYTFNQQSQKQISSVPKPSISPTIIAQRSPTPLPSETSVKEGDPTANWKTYRNEKYGFETKYHPESNLSENVGNETAGQFTYLLLIRFGTNPIKFPHGYELRINKQQSLDDYRSELIGHTTDKVDSEEEILVNGNKWTKINYEIFVTTDYASITTVITYHAGYSYALTSSSADIDQILSTFKFTDEKNQVVCTQDVKQCPDGSYVSRQPPSCAFAKCPRK